MHKLEVRLNQCLHVTKLFTGLKGSHAEQGWNNCKTWKGGKISKEENGCTMKAIDINQNKCPKCNLF